MVLTKYLDPKNDIAFKKVFGAEKNKDILIHFLNDIFNKTGEDKVKEIEFLDPSQQPKISVSKQSILDILCKDNNGNRFIVEMQVDPVRGFEKRAQYYAAHAYCNQMKKGGKYYGLKEVIFLAIADYKVFPKKVDYKSDHVILDKKTYENDLKGFSFTFIELPKFKKKLEELKSYEDKWCYFFKHASETENIEKLLLSSDEIIRKAYDELLSYNWSEKELAAYEAIEKVNMDNEAREDYLKAEGEAIGLEKGKVEGEAIGLEKGEAIGLEKGKLEIAKKMLLKNKGLEEIAEMTGLSIEQVKVLKGK